MDRETIDAMYVFMMWVSLLLILFCAFLAAIMVEDESDVERPEVTITEGEWSDEYGELMQR